MKKLIYFILLSFCLSSLIGCASGDTTNDKVVDEPNSSGDLTGGNKDNEDNITNNNSQNNNNTNNTITVEEKVLLDKEGILITLKSFDAEDFMGPALKVLIENNSKKNVTVQTADSAVNGAMMETIFSSDVAVGKKANDTINFMTSDLEVAGITSIKDIEFRFKIINTESMDTIFQSDVINIQTSVGEDYVQTFDDSGYVALDKNDYKSVIKKLNSSESFWGSDIHVYIENNSKKDITVQVRDISINGFMVEPVFSSDILADKVAFDTITFFEEDLETNDIDTINDLELSFHFIDLDSWETIYESDIVKVTFTE